MLLVLRGPKKIPLLPQLQQQKPHFWPAGASIQWEVFFHHSHLGWNLMGFWAMTKRKELKFVLGSLCVSNLHLQLHDSTIRWRPNPQLTPASCRDDRPAQSAAGFTKAPEGYQHPFSIESRCKKINADSSSISNGDSHHTIPKAGVIQEGKKRPKLFRSAV